MKTIRLLIIFAGLFSFSGVFASNFAGADLTYRCLGGNDYEITFSFYRDCSGAVEPANVQISFRCSTDSASNFSATLNKIPGTGMEVTPGCSAMPTSCAGGPTSRYGIREYIYRGIVSLPACNFWTMSYSLCCRNPSNTINAPGSQSGYVESTLNNLQAPCNSAPTFTNKPITIMCSGQTFCFNHGALDPNGDSLSYKLVTPRNGATGYVTWLAGYSATQPLPSIPPITCDPLSGDVCMTPVINIVSPIAVLITQWRTINNQIVKIGTTIRDIQVKVVSCPNSIPTLGGMDTTLTAGYQATDTTYYREICLGTTINFNMWGYDADTANPYNNGSPEKFSINWNNGIPDGTFTTHHNGTDSSYANFYWIPNQSHISSIPKCFTATILDQACPYYGSQTFSYCITVRGMWVDIGNDTLLCMGETATFTAKADTTTQNYIWHVDGVPTGTPLTSNTFTFNTNIYGVGIHSLSILTQGGGITTPCPGIDLIHVKVLPQPHVDFGNDTVLCGTSIVLDAGIANSYVWSTGQTTQSILVSSLPGGTFWVIAKADTTMWCAATDTINVVIHPDLIPSIGTISGTGLAGPDSYEFYSTSQNTIEPKFWGVVGGTIIGSSNGDTLQVKWPNTTYLSGNVHIEAGINPSCRARDTLSVVVGYQGIALIDKQDIALFPNPANTTVFLKGNMLEGFYVDFYSLTGQKLLSDFARIENTEINISSLPNGVYIYRLMSKRNSTLYYGKLLVAHD